MSTFTPQELLAMTDDDIARHLSRGFGPDKFKKMAATIRDLARKAAK